MREGQGLREGQVGDIEVHVINEVVHVRYDRVIVVVDPLRRKISDQMIVPQDVGVLRLATDVMLRRIAADRW